MKRVLAIVFLLIILFAAWFLFFKTDKTGNTATTKETTAVKTHTDQFDQKINHLMARGAQLATDDERVEDFEKMGHKVSFTAKEALERATVVMDCTPAGNQNKEECYQHLSGPRGFIAQGSEFGFGKPYARGVNDEALVPGEDRFIQVVSCNTHNITTLIRTVCDEGNGDFALQRAIFVCMRRANDITQSDSYIPAPQVGHTW